MEPSLYRRFFPRSASSLRRARKIITDFARSYLTGTALNDLETGVGEALARVVENGDGQTIVITCRCEGRRFIVEIEDRALGFQPPPGDVVRGDPEAPRGYGLIVMHSLLDEIHYLENGRRIQLVEICSAGQWARKNSFRRRLAEALV
jgi:anti-sigma regulatory factor (Ser/Thr protein kinase)